MKRKGTTYFIIFVVILLMSPILYYLHKSKYQPHLNPTPEYFMTVKGHIDPSLSKRVHITWDAMYFTTNPDCDTAGGNINKWLEGAETYRNHTVSYHVVPDHHGNYMIHIPIDAFRLGYCKWLPESIDFRVNALVSVPVIIASFTNKNDVKQPQEKAMENLHCITAENCAFSKGTLFSKSIYSKKNYEYTLNIMKVKKHDHNI